VKYKILKLRKEDEDKFWELSRKTFFESLSSSDFVSKEFHDRVFEEIKNKYSLWRKRNHIFCAKDEMGNYLGHIWFAELKNQMTGNSMLFIYDISVIDEAKGTGVAQSLMNICENYAREHGFKRICLRVVEHNKRARAFYEKLSFRYKEYIMERIVD